MNLISNALSTIIDDRITHTANCISTNASGFLSVQAVLNELVEIINEWYHIRFEESAERSEDKVAFFIGVSSPFKAFLELLREDSADFIVQDVFFIDRDIGEEALIEALVVVLKADRSIVEWSFESLIDGFDSGFQYIEFEIPWVWAGVLNKPEEAWESVPNVSVSCVWLFFFSVINEVEDCCEDVLKMRSENVSPLAELRLNLLSEFTKESCNLAWGSFIRSEDLETFLYKDFHYFFSVEEVWTVPSKKVE
jgi:hypothetical protein